MTKLVLKLRRTIGKRSSKVNKQIQHLINRGLGGGRSNTWTLHQKVVSAPIRSANNWRYDIELVFHKTSGRDDEAVIRKQSHLIFRNLKKAASSAQFANNPFEIVYKKVFSRDTTVDVIDTQVVETTDEVATITPTEMFLTNRPHDAEPLDENISYINDNDDESDSVDDDGEDLDDSDSLDEENDESAIEFSSAITLEQLTIPEILINGTDEEIEAVEAFDGIYGRGSHIRIIASSIQDFKVSNGRRRNHVVLYGSPACAKSKIINGFKQMLGGPTSGAYVSINSDSTTKAGIEKLFLDHLTQTGVPPVIFVEEMEKVTEAVLTIWLGILDERAEIRKLNFRDHRRVETNILCISTVNDKVLFDKLMGGRPNKPGALSSRFATSLYVPRPDDKIMRRILQKDIETNGGNLEWIEPCIQLSNEINTNDPRTILSFLSGRDRLLTGDFQRDIIEIATHERQDRARQNAQFTGDDE